MRCIGPALFLLAAAAPLGAQITPENYNQSLPPMPPIVTQTAASRLLNLYGDVASPLYADADFNGIDDRRQSQLHRIADRFAPLLRRNNFSFPRDFKQVLGKQDFLTADTWSGDRRVKSEQIRLGWSEQQPGDSLTANAALAALLREVDPARLDPRTIVPENFKQRGFFVDFPGSDPETWREAYRSAPQKDAAIYTHFFVHEDTAATGPARYFLVAQNWFFYPFDDAANNHEGDWEHMNVLVTTHSAIAADEHAALTAEELIAILDDDGSHIETLAIASIDYYFHESVFTLSYLAAHRSADDASAHSSWLKRQTVWREPDYVRSIVHTRLTASGGVFATHPIAYIGGDNKGPDELFSLWPRFGKAYNRNGHGTYALPGTWQSVGVMASTERIHGHVIPRLDTIHSASDDLALRIDDPMFITFSTANITIVPDWERVTPLFAAHPRATRDWGWLVMPMRWGFPVSESPGGGAIAHTDVGNISPEGPAFQPTWNRVGSADGWRQYDPEVLSVMLAPTTPWDKLKSGWGILNVPVGVFGFIPGWNVVETQLMPWLSAGMHAVGVPPDRTFRPGQARLRFTSMSAGMSYQFGGRDFASMLFDDSIPDKNISSPVQNDAAALRIGLQVYYGPKFSIENTYALSDHLLTADYVVGGVSQPVTGEISTKDLTSGFRYDIVQEEASNMHVFLRGGWGWTSYHIDDVMVGTTAGDDRKGGYMFSILPTRKWWPNSWYGGVGAEFFAPRKAWLLPQAGWGLRTELTAARHRLGATEPGTKNRGIVSRYELGVAAVIGW